MKVLTDDLEQAVFDTLKCQVKALESDLNVLSAEALIPGWAEYDRQIEGLLDDKLRLYERYLHGEVELDAYKAEMFVYDERLRKMKNARSAWMAQAEQTKEADERRQNRERAIREVAEAGKLTDALSELLIEKVFVFPGNRIEIAYKTQDIFS